MSEVNKEAGPEVQYHQCPLCKEMKKRILVGTFGSINPKNKKDLKWRDESGKLFNGFKCPPCHANAAKERYRAKVGKKA